MVGEPRCWEARSRRLLFRRLRTSSSRAARSAFSCGLGGWGGEAAGVRMVGPSPAAALRLPRKPQPPCHLLQVLLQLPEQGLQVRDLL